MKNNSLGWQNPIPNIVSHLYKDGEELGYFVQGGESLNKSVLSKLDRTITFRITNTGIFTVGAIMFGSDGQPDFDPFFGASFISLPDIVNDFGIAANQSLVRREAVGNPFLISGIKMFFPNATPGTISAQQSEPLRFRNQSIYGKNELYVLQTLNAISPTNANNAYIDIPEAGIDIDSRTDVLYNVLPGEEVWIYFTVKDRVNAADNLFSANPKIQESNDPRPTGNPLYDIIAQYENSKLETNGSTSDCEVNTGVGTSDGTIAPPITANQTFTPAPASELHPGETAPPSDRVMTPFNLGQI